MFLSAKQDFRKNAAFHIKFFGSFDGVLVGVSKMATTGGRLMAAFFGRSRWYPKTARHPGLLLYAICPLTVLSIRLGMGTHANHPQQ